jgi:hypothetical protein
MERTVPSPSPRARLHGAGELRHTANSPPTGHGQRFLSIFGLVADLFGADSKWRERHFSFAGVAYVTMTGIAITRPRRVRRSEFWSAFGVLPARIDERSSARLTIILF